MSREKVTPEEGAGPDVALSTAKGNQLSAKSDAMLAFYDACMPPYEIHLMDGTVVMVPFKKLGEKLAELKETNKERRKHVRA